MSENVKPTQQIDDDVMLQAPDWFTRMLWGCAGADAELLSQCPNSDRVKYQGLGGIVLATSVLAFMSSSYAFYTVFSPKEIGAMDRPLDMPSAAMSIVFGILWAIMIFNLDRFIVSSTGKGDCTEKITLQELVGALPRIAMGTIIGLSLSAPLEIRVLKAEIDAELAHQVRDERDRFNAQDRAHFDSERTTLTADITALEKRRDDRLAYVEKRYAELRAQERSVELEAEGNTASGLSGHGIAWKDKKANLDTMTKEFEQTQASAKEEIANWEIEVKRLKAQVAANESARGVREAENERIAQRLDGLLKRIEIAEILGKKEVNVPLFIRLLLMAIELSPIFFKLMMTKSVYDALVENRNLIIKAKHGIEGDAELFRDAKNREQYRDVFHQAAALAGEERRRAESERTLATKAHEEFIKLKAKEIEQDPTKFVTTDGE